MHDYKCGMACACAAGTSRGHNDNFDAFRVYHDNEAYYMMTSDKESAYGWVHNTNKYWQNAYYNNVADENYYYCKDETTAPADDIILNNFTPNRLYNIEFYPTRMGTQPLPDNYINLPSDNDGLLLIPFTTVTLGCDSLSADFAFKITEAGALRKRNTTQSETQEKKNSISFELTPNPNDGSFKLIIPKQDSEHYSVKVYDAQSKLIYNRENLNVELFTLNLGECPKGTYFVNVISDNQSSFKKVIVQ